MNKILISGATGFLGAAIATEFLNRKLDVELLLLVRAENSEQGLARVRERLAALGCEAIALDKLDARNILLGDFANVDAFSNDPRLQEITHVINSAAITSFSKNPLIWPINVDGTFEFAKRMAEVSSLQRFLHIGTAMACGPLLSSPIHESWQLPPEDEHLVQYTASKATIEKRLREELPDLPLVVARPSIVVGHTQLGCEPSSSIFWVFRMGQLLQKFTCSLDEKIDVIPVDYCAKAIVDLLIKPTLSHDLYHISAGKDSSCTFEAIDIALAKGLGIESLGKKYRQIGADDIAELARDFEERIGACNRRLVMRALRLYAGFAELNYVFDNARLLAEGIFSPPKFTEYAGLCAHSTRHLSIQEQMRWDFK